MTAFVIRRLATTAHIRNPGQPSVTFCGLPVEGPQWSDGRVVPGRDSLAKCCNRCWDRLKRLERGLARAAQRMTADQYRVHRAAKRRASPRSKMYDVWRAILRRCTKPDDPAFHLYGGRGIRVCDRWQGEGGFDRFLSDIGPKPSPRLTIDRVDNNGHYEPGNVRWATMAEQNKNRRRRGA